MLVGIYGVITAVDERNAEIDERISRHGPALRGFDNAFFDRRTEVLRYRPAEDLVHPLETRTAFERLEDHLTIAELPASAGLFLMAALDLDLLRDRFLVRHFRRMQRDLDVITILQLIDNRLDVKLSGARKDEL